MSCDFLSIIDVIVLFSHKTLIRCQFNFSIVEFNCDDYNTFLCIPNQCLCLVELDIETTLRNLITIIDTTVYSSSYSSTHIWSYICNRISFAFFFSLVSFLYCYYVHA